MSRRNLKRILNLELEDTAPGPSEGVTEQELLFNDGTDRTPAPSDHEAPEATGEAPRKSARLDPDPPASEPSAKQMRTSAVHHMIAGVIPACSKACVRLAAEKFYPESKCMWRLKKATYELRQAPKLWQEHFAEV